MTLATRKSYVVVDELGMDPLRDKSFDAIMAITDYTTYDVTEAFEKNAARISYAQYGTNKFWWVLLIYNGIPDNFALKKGTRLKIPTIGALTAALTRVNLSRTEDGQRTVNI